MWTSVKGSGDHKMNLSHAFTGSKFRIVAIVALALSLLVSNIGIAAAAGSDGAVYVLTNSPTGNAVAVFTRSADGTLTAAGTYVTGGLGTGASLGSQGAVALSDDGRWLFAVNAGSNEVSAFAVRRDGLTLLDKVSSGGVLPISLTYHDGLLYVLNAGGSGNITGFKVREKGQLRPIADSTRNLSNTGVGAAPGPAQVSFSPAGDLLVVTEKNTNLIDTYAVGKHGAARGPIVHTSSGVTPFGFGFNRKGVLIVSEAFGGAPDGSAVSSYRVSDDEFQVASASVATGQTAACWIAVSKNGHYAYTTNAGSGSISAYGIGKDGGLDLIDGRAGVTGDNTGPADMAISRDGQYLYALNARTHNVAAFAMQANGTLISIGTFEGLPAGSVGIAAR
jgi:6-phosphogluconolactonase (cycloisomerase 2 family)